MVGNGLQLSEWEVIRQAMVTKRLAFFFIMVGDSGEFCRWFSVDTVRLIFIVFRVAHNSILYLIALRLNRGDLTGKLSQKWDPLKR